MGLEKRECGVMFFKGIDSLFIYIQFEREYKIHVLDKNTDLHELMKNEKTVPEGVFIPLIQDELIKLESRIIQRLSYYRPIL